jgi:hypothetical protein
VPDYQLLGFHDKVVLLGNDEFAHRSYTPECEYARMYNIFVALTENKYFSTHTHVYIRFNPHHYKVGRVLRHLDLYVRFDRLHALNSDLEKKDSEV